MGPDKDEAVPAEPEGADAPKPPPPKPWEVNEPLVPPPFRLTVTDNERLFWGLAMLFLTLFAWPNLMARGQAVMRIPAVCEHFKYCQFFSGMDGRVRQEYSEPLRDRYRAAWDKVIATAHDKGFAFRSPEPFQTKPEFDELAEVGDRIYGVAWFSNRIYLNTKYMKDMSDTDLCHLEAHELGHQVDLQTERMGHEYLDRFRNLPMEAFADEFSVVICGRKALDDYRKKWQTVDWLDGGF